MNKYRLHLLVILQHGELSNREIARRRLCSPTTIARLRARIDVLGLTVPVLQEMTDSQLKNWLYDRPVAAADDLVWPNWDAVIVDLQAGDDRQEAYDVFSGNVEDGTPIAYRTFCKHLEPLLDKKNPTMRLLHRPGEKAMVDYAGFTPRGLLDDTEWNFQVFVACLPASGYGFACATATQTIPDWLWANEAMFRYFGGVTTYLVSDNLRAAVTEHRRGKPPVMNSAFAHYAEHYGAALAPARPRKPKDKAAVERFVQDVQRQIKRKLRNRPLPTLAEINVLLRDIVKELNGRQPRSCVGETRAQLFERIDRPALKPLPEEAFVYFAERLVKVPPTYHIKWDMAEYSVPHRLIACKVIVRASRSNIEIFHDGKLVAMHDRRWTPCDPVTNPDHMPAGHRAWRAKETSDLVLWSQGWGEPVQTIAQAEAARGLAGRARQLQFDLADRLVRTFGRIAFEQACLRAVAVGNHTFNHVRNLLSTNRHGLPVAEAPVLRLAPATDNVRGAAYYAGEE